MNRAHVFLLGVAFLLIGTAGLLGADLAAGLSAWRYASMASWTHVRTVLGFYPLVTAVFGCGLLLVYLRRRMVRDK